MCPCTLEKDFLINLPTALRSVIICIIKNMSVKICLHGYSTTALTTQCTETLIAAGDVLTVEPFTSEQTVTPVG